MTTPDADTNRIIEHHCHAYGCKTPCERKMFMCRLHWAMVPVLLKVCINNTYTSGQELGKVRPSKKWFEYTLKALHYVKEREATDAQEKGEGK